MAGVARGRPPGSTTFQPTLPSVLLKAMGPFTGVSGAPGFCPSRPLCTSTSQLATPATRLTDSRRALRMTFPPDDEEAPSSFPTGFAQKPASRQSAEGLVTCALFSEKDTNPRS